MKFLLKAFLLFNYVIAIVNCLIYVSTGDEKWFSRFFVAIVCGGFLYLGECIESKKE
jgi:hypothetical protein